MNLRKKIILKVIEREGGEKITNDSDDRGGLTKYGISKRANPDIDIENLTLDEAVDIYKDRYWNPSKCDLLPSQIREIYFDMAVNMGIRRAVKILQKACNNKGGKLQIDGMIGKNTIKASRNIEPDRLKSFRILHYANIVINNPSQMKYYYGWVKRTMHCT